MNDAYTANAANEYTQIVRNSIFTNPVHDAAGNMTALPTRPATGVSAGLDVTTALAYDAFNRPITVTAGGNAEQVYLYDALGRRIVAMELAVPYTSSVPTTVITAGRRYIYDGWSVATERVFNSGATLEAAPSTLERIYVEGPMLDEHILCAIDGDGGGLFTNLNEPVSAGGPNTNDYHYYYLPNRLGNTMALLSADPFAPSASGTTLEYYRYTVYGEATVLPVVDVAPADGLEDTPLDLTDNNALMLAQRGPGTPGAFDPTAGRASQFNNQYTFTGRYLDTSTGLHYFRYRYYEARAGRFAQRDPVEVPWNAQYSYAQNAASATIDPVGLFYMPPTNSVETKIRAVLYGLLEILGITLVVLPEQAPSVADLIEIIRVAQGLQSRATQKLGFYYRHGGIGYSFLTSADKATLVFPFGGGQGGESVGSVIDGSTPQPPPSDEFPPPGPPPEEKPSVLQGCSDHSFGAIVGTENWEPPIGTPQMTDLSTLKRKAEKFQQQGYCREGETAVADYEDNWITYRCLKCVGNCDNSLETCAIKTTDNADATYGSGRYVTKTWLSDSKLVVKNTCECYELLK